MSESPCEGIRLHFLLRRKLLFRCRPAGIDQAATGSLDLIFESHCKAKKKDTQRVSFFLCLVNTIDSIRSCCNQLCTSVNIPTGCSRMHRDSPTH